MTSCKFMGGGFANVMHYHPQWDLSNLNQIVDAVFVSRFSTFEMQVIVGMQKFLLFLWPEGGKDRMTKRENFLYMGQQICIVKNKNNKIDENMRILCGIIYCLIWSQSQTEAMTSHL
ncbi:hypothetical protein ILYODFUR_035556 [Ilyodon furcidens]|uniref:Uncharacterized protein n=1 Tax=Ilyodon furcidens TaxID=33524 RepID=A0ABV0UNM1_9TELE